MQGKINSHRTQLASQSWRGSKSKQERHCQVTLSCSFSTDAGHSAALSNARCGSADAARPGELVGTPAAHTHRHFASHRGCELRLLRCEPHLQLALPTSAGLGFCTLAPYSYSLGAARHSLFFAEEVNNESKRAATVGACVPLPAALVSSWKGLCWMASSMPGGHPIARMASTPMR